MVFAPHHRKIWPTFEKYVMLHGGADNSTQKMSHYDKNNIRNVLYIWYLQPLKGR